MYARYSSLLNVFCLEGEYSQTAIYLEFKPNVKDGDQATMRLAFQRDLKKHLAHPCVVYSALTLPKNSQLEKVKLEGVTTFEQLADFITDKCDAELAQAVAFSR